jgi:hypothetical protein
MNTTLKALLVSTAFAATIFGSASYAAGPESLLHFVASESVADLKAMEGKRVLGKNRELLGHIGKVDELGKIFELKTPSGAIVSIPTDVLVEDDDALAAPSLSRGDILALIDRPGQEPSIREVGAQPRP